MMLGFYALVSRISLWAGWLSALILVLITALIAVEILLRNVFGTSTFITGEFVGYGVATMTVFAMGHTLAHGELIRVQLLVTRLGLRGRQIVEVLCVALTFTVSSFLAWYFFQSALRQWENGAVSVTIAEVPLWIPQAMMLIGLVLFSLQLLGHGLAVLIDPRHALPSSGAHE